MCAWCSAAAAQPGERKGWERAAAAQDVATEQAPVFGSLLGMLAPYGVIFCLKNNNEEKRRGVRCLQSGHIWRGGLGVPLAGGAGGVGPCGASKISSGG